MRITVPRPLASGVCRNHFIWVNARQVSSLLYPRTFSLLSNRLLDGMLKVVFALRGVHHVSTFTIWTISSADVDTPVNILAASGQRALRMHK